MPTQRTSTSGSFTNEFLVFDEVHTYDGLFGYTSTLMKRVQALRENRDVDDLQLIASSATVENDVELFQKVSGAVDVTQVSESPRELDVTVPSSVPEELTSHSLSVDRILRATGTPDDAVPGLDTFDYTLEEASSYDRDRRGDTGRRCLIRPFDRRSRRSRRASCTVRPPTALRRSADTLGTASTSWPRPSTSVRQVSIRWWRTSAHLGEFSESWKTAVTCSPGRSTGSTRVQRAKPSIARHRIPVGNADSSSPLVPHTVDTVATNISLPCTVPECDQLEPYTPTEHGSVGRDEDHVCTRCEGARDDPVQMVRATFQPGLGVPGCAHRAERTTIDQCSDCGFRTVGRTRDGDLHQSTVWQHPNSRIRL